MLKTANKCSDFIKDDELYERLCDCQLLKADCTP